MVLPLGGPQPLSRAGGGGKEREKSMSAEMTRHMASDWGPRNYPISHFLSSLLAAEVSQGSRFD